MNKLPFLAFVFVAGSASSQNVLQQVNFGNSLNNSDGNIQLTQTNQAAQQIFASNVSVNRANVSTVNRNVSVRRSNNVSQRRINTHAQANVVNNVNLNQDMNDGNKFNPQANPVNQQPLLIKDNTIQINKIEIQQMITAVGNQSQPLGIANSSNVGISLNINLPKINFKTIKFSSSSSMTYRSFRLKTFFAKFNRKMKGKFSFTKSLKIKVDNCFRF